MTLSYPLFRPGPIGPCPPRCGEMGILPEGRLAGLLDEVRPEDHAGVQRSQHAITRVIQTVLEKQCPLDITAVLPHGPSGRGTMVKRHQQDLDLLLLLGGCVGSGSYSYLAALLDLLLEFCKTQFNTRERGQCNKFKPSHYFVSFVWNHPNGERRNPNPNPTPSDPTLPSGLGKPSSCGPHRSMEATRSCKRIIRSGTASAWQSI